MMDRRAIFNLIAKHLKGKVVADPTGATITYKFEWYAHPDRDDMPPFPGSVAQETVTRRLQEDADVLRNAQLPFFIHSEMDAEKSYIIVFER